MARPLTRALSPALLALAVVAVPGVVSGVVPGVMSRAVAAPSVADSPAAVKTVPGVVLRPKAPAAVLPVAVYRLTGRFGDSSGLWSTMHTGLDFAAPYGTPIRTIASGVVVSTGYDGAYGEKTVVRLADGTELWFCHQSLVGVEVGERVRTGERIGAVGSTGNVTGPHLHLEVRPRGGSPVDPVSWLRARGLRP